ncbi:MAG: DUF6461 domain-containing protein [Chloroflexota bacterium]
MAANGFGWAAEIPALCLTFLEGMSPAEVESQLCGDPTTRHTATFAEAADAQDYAAERFALQFGEVDGWTVIVEPNGYVCSQDAVLEALSANGPAAMVFWNVNMDSRFGYARNGALVRVFDPVLGTGEVGDPLPEEAGLPAATEPIPAALMLAEALTGVTVDGPWVLDRERPTVTCPLLPNR